MDKAHDDDLDKCMIKEAYESQGDFRNPKEDLREVGTHLHSVSVGVGLVCSTPISKR